MFRRKKQLPTGGPNYSPKKQQCPQGARITLQAELDTLVFDFENLEATQTAAQAKLGDAHMSTWINSLGPNIQGRGI